MAKFMLACWVTSVLNVQYLLFPLMSHRLLNNSRIRQLADWATRGLDISCTGYCSTCGLDNLRTGQVADWATRGSNRPLCVLSFRLMFSCVRT